LVACQTKICTGR